MHDVIFNTVSALKEGLLSKKYSSVELTTEYLDRITTIDTSTNSFITVCEEEALRQAARADELIKQGKAGILTGIPYANKDIFCTKNVRTSCGSKMLDSFIAPYNATVVEKCIDAGMVMLGKTNMDEFAMGSSNETSFYGRAKNPWDLTRVSGGSSGGSATAVAARLVPLATGSDTGGSIRQPAAFCGISGLKPTYGRVSRYGMIAFGSSLDQGGPMAHCVEDLALLLSVIAGHDRKDSTSNKRGTEDFCRHLNKSIKNKVIGIPKEYFSNNLNPEIQLIMDEAIKQIEKLGAEIKDVSLPSTSLVVPTYYVLASAECSSNMSRYDGVRFGHRCEDPNSIDDLYERSRAEGFGDEVKRRILMGTYALSSGYYDAYYEKAQKIRRLVKNDYISVFKDVDFLIGPTCPSIAFHAETFAQDPVQMYLSDVYTVSANLAGLPSLSLPAGFSHGMPVGMQITGNYFMESELLSLGHAYQTSTDWHNRYTTQELGR